MNKELSAGSTIETRCTRCKGVLNHTIVAMVGEKIVRVECSTCHGVHSYNPVKVPKELAVAKATKKKVAAPRKTKADPEAVARAEWEALQPGMDPAQAIPYDMNRTYRVKNMLFHPNFGLGIVQLLLQTNKIEVLFQTGKKRLRSG
ncbi:MAG: hypothetical protein WA140_05360 [Geobacteraceae bacterium]